MLKKRIFGLDLLRFFSIFIVVYVHGIHIKGDSSFLNQLYTSLQMPVDGVTVFFVLSGFLIGEILLKTIANTSLTKSELFYFWIRRWFRTLPNYFLILSCLIFIHYHDFPSNIFLPYYIFIQNLFHPHPAFFPEAWSLAVEEWFYLFTPLYLYCLLKIGSNRQKTVLFWISSILIFSVLARAYQTWGIIGFDYPQWDENVRKIVSLRLDSIMYGVLGAYIKTYHPQHWSNKATKSFIIGVLFVLFFIPVLSSAVSPQFMANYLIIPVSSIAILLLVPKLATWHVEEKRFIPRFIIFISQISYAMYLIHLSLIQWSLLKFKPFLITHLGSYADLALYFSYWLLTILMSTIIYKFYECPMTSLRDKFPLGRIHFFSTREKVSGVV